MGWIILESILSGILVFFFSFIYCVILEVIMASKKEQNEDDAKEIAIKCLILAITYASLNMIIELLINISTT
jgi:hypothetical protein